MVGVRPSRVSEDFFRNACLIERCILGLNWPRTFHVKTGVLNAAPHNVFGMRGH
jgi:hypothetical protein